MIKGAIAIFLGVVAGHAAIDVSKLPPPADKKDVTFAREIKPLFERSCVKCHGEERPKAKLRLDSLEAVKKGSEYGPVIVAGKSDKSSLVHSISGLNEDILMPPEGKAEPLTKQEVSLVRAWIDQGAK